MLFQGQPLHPLDRMSRVSEMPFSDCRTLNVPLHSSLTVVSLLPISILSNTEPANLPRDQQSLLSWHLARAECELDMTGSLPPRVLILKREEPDYRIQLDTSINTNVNLYINELPLPVVSIY